MLSVAIATTTVFLAFKPWSLPVASKRQLEEQDPFPRAVLASENSSRPGLATCYHMIMIHTGLDAYYCSPADPHNSHCGLMIRVSD